MENGNIEESSDFFLLGKQDPDKVALRAMQDVPAGASDRELRARANLAGEAYARRMTAINRWKAAQQIAKDTPQAIEGEDAQSAELRQQAAFKAIEKHLVDVDREGIPTGRFDRLGTMWKQGGFETGAQAFAFMSDLLTKGPEAGLTQDYKDFYAQDWAGQVALARKNRSLLKTVSAGVGEGLSTVVNGFQTAALTGDELRGAPEDIIKANEVLIERDTHQRLDRVGADPLGMVAASSIPKNPYVRTEEIANAEKRIDEYRQRLDDEAVRAEYAMMLNKKNAWSALTTILPSLSKEAQSCAKAMLDSADGALPAKYSATFMNLPERDQQTIIVLRKILKKHEESTIGNTIEDALTGAANTAINLLTAPYRQANKYTALALNGLSDTGIDVNEIAQKRQRLYEATGSFFAGGIDPDTGMLPAMQWEQKCDDHGILAEAVIGAVSTLPYMAAAGAKGASFTKLGKMGGTGRVLAKAGTAATSGTSLVALEAMQEFDNHTVLNGGDITSPGYIARSFVMGGLYAYIEKLQVNGLLGGMSDQRVREGLLKGFWSGVKNGTAPRVLFTETLSESVQEGLQSGVMAIHEALALDKNVAKEFGTAFVEDFVGSLGTMAVIGAGGLVVGHMGRSGMHLRGANGFSASELRHQERSKDLSSLYMAQFAHNNMVQANARTEEFRQAAMGKELASLRDFWNEGGVSSLVEKGGISANAAERLDEFFKALRASEGSAVQQSAGEAVDEWNRSRGVETAPKAGESGEIGQHYLENLVNSFIRGGMSRNDFTSRLVSMGFSEAGASDYAAWNELERKVFESGQALTGFIQGQYERRYGSDSAVHHDLEMARAALSNLETARSVWAQGMGIRYKDGGEVQDPGAKALQEFGFTKEDSEKLSRLFHYERAAAYSKVALDGIRAMYEKATRGRVSGKAAIASEFKGRIERLAVGTDEKGKSVFGDFIRFKLPKGRGEAYVRIVETPTGAPDFTKADRNIAESIAEATKNLQKPVTADEWLSATPEERERIWKSYNLYDEGFFTPDETVDLQLMDDPAAKITSKEAKRLVFGSITLAGNSQLEQLADINAVAAGITIPDMMDSSAGFHEVYHAWRYFMNATGAWTEAEEKQLAAAYGKESSGMHNEEAAANALRSYMNRRITGRSSAEDETSPFAKIYSLARKLIRRGEEKAIRSRIAANAEEAFFDQIIVDNYSGLGELGKEPKKEEKPEASSAAAPQMPGRKEKADGVDSASGQKSDEKVEDAKVPTGQEKPKAAPKPAAQRGWTAYTPTGNIKVGGHWAVVQLADLIHSNHPAYAIHMRKQLRNRKDNKAEEDTRKNIVNNFQGERLLEAPDTANGAPIVFLAPDDKGVERLFVLSGNGRVLVLNELAERHLYDQYRNVMKAWAEENGLAVPEGDTPVLVRVIDDLGGSTLDTIADLSNTNAIQQYTEEEQARADAEVIKALNIARLYHANANGTADMTPGVNDEFFSEFIRGVGDTSLYNSDRSLTETARVRAVRALLAIAVGQGDRGRDVVKKLIEQTDTLNIARQKNAAAIMAAAVAALETNDAYAIGPDVSRAMADFIDYAEKKKAGKVGTFGDYFNQMDLIDGPSELAREILQLFGSKMPAADIAEYVVAYCRAAAVSDPTGGLFGADGARSRIDIWKDAKNLVDERRAADGGAEKHSYKAETDSLYRSAAEWIPWYRFDGSGSSYRGHGLNLTTAKPIEPKEKHSVNAAHEVELADKDLAEALEKYGKAENPSEAVYALPNGTLMRGKETTVMFLHGKPIKSFGHDGFTDDILKRLPEEKVPSDRQAASAWMIGRMDAAKRAIARTGAIRLASDGSLMEIFKEPTAEQYSSFYDIVYYVNDELVDDVTTIDIDVSDENLNTTFSISYRVGTSPRRIIEDIKGWYRDGVLPLGANGPAATTANVESLVRHSISGVDFVAMAKYYQGDVRKLTRALKKSNPYALKIAAESMARAIPEGAVLVPVPGYDGRAGDTFALANEIAKITGSPVVEALHGVIREPIYLMKQSGYLPTSEDLGFYKSAPLPENRKVVLIDNVVGTGTTAVAAREALGQGVVVAFAWDHTAPSPIGISGGLAGRRHSVSADEDAAYIDAVKRGDMKTARRMVDEAIEKSGYSTPHYFDAHSAPAPAYVEGGRENFRNLEELRRVSEEDGGDLNLFAIANGISPVPDDYFTPKGLHLYMQTTYGRAATESLQTLAPAIDEIQRQMEEFGEVRDMPTLVVYRAVPDSVKEGSLQSEGQWVSPSKTYVIEHGKSRFGEGKYRIIEQAVGADELWFDGNAITEWGFDDGRGGVYKNTKNNRKFADTVTYDDNGEIIPLSQRFNDADSDPRHSVRAEEKPTKEQLELFADAKEIKEPSRRKALKKAVDGFARFAKEYRTLYTNAIRRGEWAPLLDFADAHGIQYASNVLKQYFTEPHFDTVKLAGLKIARAEDVAAILMTARSPFVESIKAIYLDEEKRIIDAKILSIGQPSNTFIAFGAVSRELPKGAKYVVLSHNHPSGHPNPSKPDEDMTKAIAKELEPTGAQLLDHIITDGTQFYSFNDRRLHPISVKKPKWEVLSAGGKDAVKFTTREGLTEYMSMHLRDDGDCGHVICVNKRLEIVAVRRISSAKEILKGGHDSVAEWVDRMADGIGATAASGIIVDLGPGNIADTLGQILTDRIYRRFDLLGVGVVDVLAGTDDMSSWQSILKNAEKPPLEEASFARYSFAIGEGGASNLKDALFVSALLRNAREMLGKRDWAKIPHAERVRIKFATGWEKGADGKWRLERPSLPDLKMSKFKKIDAEEKDAPPKYEPITIGKLFPKADIFEAYPWLKRTVVELGALDPKGSTRGQLEEKDGEFKIRLRLSESETPEVLKGVLTHELQHQIQRIEDFARGGNMSVAKQLFLKRYEEASKEARPIWDEEHRLVREIFSGRSSLKYHYLNWPKKSPEYKEALEFLRENDAWRDHEYRAAEFKRKWGHQVDYFMEGSYRAFAMAFKRQFKDYQRLAGEVEARNVAAREHTPDVLLEDTEDVDRRYQVLVNGALEEFARVKEAAESAEKHSFAGMRGGNVAGVKSIDDAEVLEGRGEDKETVFRLTGWFRGADGLWRVELPFHGRFVFEGDFDGGMTKGYRTVSDYFDWPELYQAYPELRDVEVKFEDLPEDTRGDFDAKTKTIRISNAVRKGGSGIFAKWRVAPIMVHEIQHVIQSIENHARGGDPDDFLTWDRIKVRDVINRLKEARDATSSAAEREELTEMIREHESNLRSDAESAEAWYYRLAGEVEARNAADRFFRSPSWRLAHPPWETEDTKREDQHLDFTEEEDVHWDDVDVGPLHSIAARLETVRREIEAEGGQLLLGYHGTRQGGFTVFDQNKNDEGAAGFYFAKSRDTAMTYSSEPYDIYDDDGDVGVSFIEDNALYNKYGIYNVALKMMKPLSVECGGSFWHSVPNPFKADGGVMDTREVARIAFESGYDGVIFKNISDFGNGAIQSGPTDVYAVKEPNQIKVVDAVTYDDEGNVIPDEDRFMWDDPDIRHSVTTAWGRGFPDITFMTTRKFIKDNEELSRLHELAKAGSLDAALKYVNTLIPDNPKSRSEMIRYDKIKQLAVDFPDATLVPVVAHEKSGHNMLPYAYAARIRQLTGFKVLTSIQQVVKANHTGADGLERIVRSASFEGNVVRGRRYIMVDDHVTQGGTLGALRRHIIDRGGKIVAATTLTISRGSSILSPRDVTLQKLTAKFGNTFAGELRKAGVVNEPSDLTESQAQYLLKYTPEHFRDLAARAFSHRSEQAANQNGPGYAGLLRTQVRSGSSEPAGAPSTVPGRESGNNAGDVRQSPGRRSSSSDVGDLIPALRKYWNPETKTVGNTRFAQADIIRGPISKELDAAIAEATGAGEMSGEEKLKFINGLIARIKETKEGKIVFGRYKEGDSWDGSDADWNKPQRRELHERIYRELALDPVTGNNNEALEINKRTGKPKGFDVINRANEADPELPRISNDADAQYTPLRGHRLDIVIGPPAAGKSSVFVDQLSVYHRARVFDSDAIKKRLPGFDNGNGASFVHEESSKLNKEILRRFLDRHTGENVVLPIVGASVSSVMKYVDLFRQEGYSIYLHNNFVPITHAFGRAWERTLSTGRLIPPEVFVGCMDAPSAVFEELRNRVDFWDEFNNDGPLGGKPIYVRGNYVDEAYGGIVKDSETIVATSWGLFANPQLMFDFANALDREEAGYRPLFERRLMQGEFKFDADPEGSSKHAIRADIRENRQKAAEEALTNWITYFRLSHGSIPRERTIARMGLAMGMGSIQTKRILDKSETRAEQMRGTLIEKAAANGDIATTIALLKREDGIDESIGNLLAGGVAKGAELTHRGVGQINTIIGKRVEQMMRDFTAATLADMEGETGLDIAAEILQQNPDAFADEIKGAKGTDPNKPDNQDDQNTSDTDGPDGGGDGGDDGFRQETDLERYNREQARAEALKKVEDFIARAKEKAAENRAKAEERRRRQEGEDGVPVSPEGGDGTLPPMDLEQEVNKAYGANPVNVKANFKTKEEFAAFMRVWAEHKFDRTHGISSLGKAERERLFAEFYRITVRQELQDLADKLLAPKDEKGITISRIAKLGNGARNVVSRRIGELEKGLKPDTIERISGSIFAFINMAAIRVSRTDLVSEFKKEIKAKYIKGENYEDLKLDTDRRVTGWVEEAARYICRVCDLSKRGINGDISQLAAERKELLEIINRRADVYDESGKEVAQAAVEDMETKKAMWKLALLDKYGAMTSLMPGEILDLRQAAFEYLEKQAAELEKLWKDTRAYEEGIRKDLCGAIAAPNGQRYREQGWLDGRLFDALNGLLRLRLQHLTRFADKTAQAAAKESINKIIVMLADGEVEYNKMLQDDRQALFEGLGSIFQKDGRVDNGAIKRYLNRMTEPIPAQLAQQISRQGFGDSMTYGQMLQLLVSLEQRSFSEAVEHNGRQDQAELIRNFTVVDEKGNRTHVFTQEDNQFIEWLRAFYAAKRDVISPVTLRMVGQTVDSPDPLYCPVKRSMEDRVQPLAGSPSTWDPIAAVFTRRVRNNRDFDEQASILGMFFDRSNETAKLVAWAERGTVIRGVFTNVGVQSAIRRAFGPGELRKIMTQLLATFNGGENRKQTPGELAAVDKALNFTTYAYLGFNPLSAAKQTVSFTVWANALPGGFKDLWKYMTHFDAKVIKHLKESDVYKVRYGDDVGSGQDLATKGLNANPSMNPIVRMFSGAGMWLLKKGDFLPGAWIASGVYKDLLDKHLHEGMEFDEADKLAITETFNMLEETQQSGRTYNTNMLTIEHGRIGRLLTQFATSPLQQLQYETQAWREWRDMVRYNQGEKKIAAARRKLVRAAVINHLLLPAALNFVTAVFKKLMGEEPPWEKDGYHWSLLIDVLLGQFSRVFFIGVFSQTALKALFSREYPRAGQILPVEGVLGMTASLCITAHDIATLDSEKIRKDIERLAKATAPTRIPYNIYRRIVGDSDVDRKAAKEAKKRK